MRRILLKLLLFITSFFLFDKLFLIVSNLSPELEIDKRLELLLNGKISKDVIIAGSSRGSRDILAEQIENMTSYTAFNLSYPGSNIEFHEFIIRTLIKFNNKPKIILLVVDDSTYFKSDYTTNDRKDRLYPLIKYPYIQQELIDKGEKNKLLSRFFILHRLNKSNFQFKRKSFGNLDTIKICGSMPISLQKEGWKWNYKYFRGRYNPNDEIVDKVKYFNRIIDTCSKKGIKVIIVFPPNFQNHSSYFENRIRHLTNNRLQYLVYDMNNPVYKNYKYFYDDKHLMKNGAEIFTSEIIDYLNTKKKEEHN